MDEIIIENFHGVYLLYCKNVEYFGRNYIGYTTNPKRRILQHNKGKKYGGAWKTSKKGPWSMVMIIHGFPNEILALQFEWAWQHPQESRRLSQMTRKRHNELNYDYNLRILSEMLNVGPWTRLPLTIQWLDTDLIKPLPKTPPLHMPITIGGVISKKLQIHQSESSNTPILCTLCNQLITDKPLKCLNNNCNLNAHILCLSTHFLNDPNHYIPIEGTCPKCMQTYLWGDIIRKLNGCYKNIDLEMNLNEFQTI